VSGEKIWLVSPVFFDVESYTRLRENATAALAGPEIMSAEDVAFTLLVGRDAMPERLAILAEDVAGLNEQLAAFAAAMISCCVASDRA